MQKLLVVVCTRASTNEIFKESKIYASLEKQKSINSNIESLVLKKNKKGLSSRYNQVIKDSRHRDKVVLFVHDDVELSDVFLYEKLIESPYDITGVAGNKSLDKDAPSMAWWLCNKNIQTQVGAVTHSFNGAVYTSVYGPTHTTALVIDGFFMSCKINKFLEKDLYFDERFDFHHYDMSLGLNAYDKKVSVGVLPLAVIHYSPGPINTLEWQQSNKKFKELYCS